ncbi:maleylpyruvate isomerase family mycothiol-dependent enzyme [Nocardioides jensenii]|uniref:maleylpyruvate isomerase family mycothiol-dependent enzyme n=1 Tax=Nocardioides jensenii TaxID=1843 RepID=UPI000AB4C718|nr:maleylpyruvate isomerase family mycothiol-dependent enzyme [Nocardioides jensenii]
MAQLSAMAADERRDLADFLETLTDEEWERPSLCPGWSVRDVAGHVPSYDMLGWPAFLAMFARSGFSLDRCNRTRIEQVRGTPTTELVERLRTYAVPRGITSMFGSAIALTDAVIHHQDIRRALGRPREVPPERLLAALEFLPRARVLPSPQNLRGLRVIATDLDWSSGEGPEVRGPGEALVVAFAGRPAALDELEGSGLDTLAARVRG